MFLSLLLISGILALLWGAGTCVLAVFGLRAEHFSGKSKWALPLAVSVSAGLLFVVYMTYPGELLWALGTSADRVTLPAKLAVAAGIYLLIAERAALYLDREP